ncbi:hypothetical protein QJS04_geneDACA009766 [Acorus gramineus]|uniref:HMG box domain-containing protein n=1 Tax=Acorus gramineus TaxID=55184 RepID=A0AAV9BBH2_ACOGR|nr:hypothetical protein QJS04_geneDACA009766 [Acorus gramineus]
MKGGKSKAETTKKAESKLSVKNTAKKPAVRKPAAKKAGKDPNKPKRPASAFFVFMEEFRKQYKEKHPNNKSVAAVGKACGEKWKSMNEADKAPFVARAAKRKTEYEAKMVAYNKKQSSGGKAEEEEEEEASSGKSKSEVEDDDDDEDESGEEEDDD